MNTLNRLARIIMLFLVIDLCSNALADGNEFQIDGEWFGGTYYSNDYYVLSRNDSGDYIFENQDNSYIKPDGTICFNEQTVSTEIVQLTDSSFISIIFEDNSFVGFLVIDEDDEIKGYQIDSNSMVLILNGKMIRYDGSASADYLYSNDMFYMTDGESSYTRGTIKQYGNDFFIYEIDTDPYIYEYGEYSIDHGTPVMFFLRSSIAG